MSSNVAVEVGIAPVREFVGDRAPQPQPLGYRVVKMTYGSGPKSVEQYEASIPERQITWIGATEEQAIGLMLRGFGELCRSGAIIEQRRQHIESENEGDGSRVVDKNDVELPSSPRLARLNEIISGLATSIAALARVKEL